MKGASVKKVIMIPFVIPKNFNLHRPPIHVFSPYFQDFLQTLDADIFIKYLGSRTPVRT